MTPSRTVLILGARGRLGSALVRAFAAAGWQVRAQVRPGATGLPNLHAVQWLALDPRQTDELVWAAQGTGVVVHALSPAYTHAAWRREVLPLGQAAIDLSRALGALLMLPGNVYNFGRGMPACLLEDTPQQADTVKGRLRIALEQRIAEACGDGRMRAAVIRAGDFFGSGSGSYLDLVLAKDLERGILTLPGGLEVATPWAYLPDLARSFVAVAERAQQLPAFASLHFAGHQVRGADWLRVLQALAQEQGWIGPQQQLAVKHLPWPLLRVLALVSPKMQSIAEMRYLWRTPHALANRRLVALAGPEPHTPFVQAVRQSLADLGLLHAAPATTHLQGSLA